MPKLGNKVVIAAEAVDFIGERARVAEEHKTLVGEVRRGNRRPGSQGMPFADHQQQRLTVEQFHRKTRIFKRLRNDGQIEVAVDHAAY